MSMLDLMADPEAFELYRQALALYYTPEEIAFYEECRRLVTTFSVDPVELDAQMLRTCPAHWHPEGGSA